MVTPPPMLDLMVLTFNCAKTLINVPVFAAHLRTAFQPASTGPGVFSLPESGPGGLALPEVIVFSLQEVAPLAYSFVGSYFLNPFYARFEEALNLAASQILQEQQSTPSSPTTQDGLHTPTTPTTPGVERSSSSLWRRLRGQSSLRPYHLVKVHNVGMTAILLFARTPAAIQNLKHAEVAFGAADMGNKGAVAFRFNYTDTSSQDALEVPRAVEFTFVATHLAAMEWNLRRRNANWRSIISGLTFRNPLSILPPEHHIPEPGSKAVVEASAQDDDIASVASEGEQERLLARHENAEAMSEDLQRSMQDISVYKAESYLFVAGDLNYRISTSTPPALATFPNLDKTSDDFFLEFFDRDQLTQEKAAGRTLQGLKEAKIEFPPSYKIVHLDGVDGAVNKAQIRRATGLDGSQPQTATSNVEASRADGEIDEKELRVPWKWAPHRWPGWCDRILFLDKPSWAQSGTEDKASFEIKVTAYKSLPVMRSSDHRPVYLRAQVPLTPIPSPPKDVIEAARSDTETVADPRVRLPVPIDTGAWQRRAAARRKELMAGWSMMLFSTREGAILIGTTVAIGLGSWYYLAGSGFGG